MKLKVQIFILIILLIVGFLIHYTACTYFSQIEGNICFSIAEPICRAIIQDNCIYISNYEPKPLYFSICNFNEKGKVTEIGMKYNIMVKSNQPNAPLKYRLYRINKDGSEENIQVNNSRENTKTALPTTLGTLKEIHNYKLEIEYDNEDNIILDKNIILSIILESEQIILK